MVFVGNALEELVLVNRTYQWMEKVLHVHQMNLSKKTVIHAHVTRQENWLDVHRWLVSLKSDADGQMTSLFSIRLILNWQHKLKSHFLLQQLQSLPFRLRQLLNLPFHFQQLEARKTSLQRQLLQLPRRQQKLLTTLRERLIVMLHLKSWRVLTLLAYHRCHLKLSVTPVGVQQMEKKLAFVHELLVLSQSNRTLSCWFESLQCDNNS